MDLNAINIPNKLHVQENVQGNYVKIKKIAKINSEPVYNMHVEKVNNFSINGGIIVHNCIDSIRYGLNDYITNSNRQLNIKYNKSQFNLKR